MIENIIINMKFIFIIQMIAYTITMFFLFYYTYEWFFMKDEEVKVLN